MRIAGICQTAFIPRQPAFRGNCGYEIIPEDNLAKTQNSKLTQTTHFFRDVESLEFIGKHFANKDKIKVLVGACSSGEEAWTLQMLLGRKAKIEGFDLGKSAVNQANSGIIYIRDPEKSHDFNLGYADAYLGYEGLFYQHKAPQRAMFNEYFEKVRTKPEVATFKVKEDKKDLIKFFRADITNLKPCVEKGAYDALTFRNALYLLVSGHPIGGRVSRPPQVALVLDNACKNINYALKPGGLFVLGELSHDHDNESGQMVYRALKRNGFALAFTQDYDKVTVWKKKWDMNI